MPRRLVSRSLLLFTIPVGLAGCNTGSAWFDHIPARAYVDVVAGTDLDATLPEDGVRMTFATDLATVDRYENENTVQLRLREHDDDSFVRIELFALRERERFDFPDRDDRRAPFEILVRRPAGFLRFDGRVGEEGRAATGELELRLIAPVRDRIVASFGAAPTVLQGLQIVCTGVEPDTLLGYREARRGTGLALALELARRGTPREELQRFMRTGLDYPDEDIVRLLRNGVTLATAAAWPEAGRALTVDELIECRQWGIRPADYTEWRAAGRDLRTEELQWVRQRGIRAEAATRWQKAGRSLDLQQLYWVKQRGLTERHFAAWVDAGRTLALSELYWVRQRGIRPAHHVAWRDAGYDLSLEDLYWVRQRGLPAKHAKAYGELGFEFSTADLYRLRQYGITPQYARRFVDSAFELPTTAELVDYRRRGVTAADAKKLRRRRDG